MGNIVRRVLKVIREVARGELEVNHEKDEYGFEEEEEEEEEDDSPPASARNLSSTTSSVTGERTPTTPYSSMFRLLADVSRDDNSSDTHEKKTSYNLKPIIIQEINEEIIADLDMVYKGIADQAVDYIHAK